ncbi:MAG: hypothetical protein ACI837_001623 [Crocinitomicaceae bacterium]
MSKTEHYQSPLRLLKELGLSPKDAAQSNLDSAKKRLLLELQISEKNSIQIGANDYTKNDLLHLFDNLTEIDDLDVHVLISEHPALLGLLEHSKLPENLWSAPKIGFKNHDLKVRFNKFVSPYLAHALNKCSSKAVKNQKFAGLYSARNYFEYLDSIDFQFSFKKVNIFCETFRAEVNALSNSQKKFSPQDYSFLTEVSFYNLVAVLSNEFSLLIDTVVYSVINFTVHFQYSGKSTFLIDACLSAERLDCSEEFKALLVKNRRAFESNQSRNINRKTSSSSSNSSGNSRVIWGVIAIILLIAKLIHYSTRNNGSDDYSSYQLPYALQQQLDREKVIDLEEYQSFLAGSIDDPDSYEERNTNYSSFSDTAPGLNMSMLILSSVIDTSTFDVTFLNKTSHEVVLIAAHGSLVMTRYIKPNDLDNFTTSREASFFLYTGNLWDYSKWIPHDRYGQIRGLNTISLNGYFMSMTAANKLLVRENFMLFDFPDGIISLKDENDTLKLYNFDDRVRGTQVSISL